MRIALLEDDEDQSRLIELWLTEAGHTVHGCTNGADFQRSVRNSSFDLLIIDWLLPDTSGIEVLDWVREYVDRQVPVLFVTVRDSEEDIVRALSHGADDYMIKPVRRMELLARISALGRRTQPQPELHDLMFGVYHLNVTERTVNYQDAEVQLTPKEFELALFLFRNAGRLLSRGHILESVWGRRPDLNTRTVDTHISRLRRKLNLEPENGCRLTAVYHHGYRLEFLTENQEETA